jgi:SRSO17 transposase
LDHRIPLGIEESFQVAKTETGLDHYQVRTYTAWYCHITLSLLAAAFPAVTACTKHLQPTTTPHAPLSN